ncbi:hypothetical protein MJD09_14990 [bacterium]|nr:hypothetical protein [bacterium]
MCRDVPSQKTFYLFVVLSILTLLGPKLIAGERSADALQQSVVAFEFLTFRGGDQTQLEIFCEIPEHQFQFVKYVGGFYASYELSVSIRDERNGLVYAKTVIDSVKVSEFNEIDLLNAPHIIRFTHRGAPGEYTAQIHLKDLETLRGVNFAKMIELPDYRDSTVRLSDLQLGSRILLTKEEGKLVKHLDANVRRAFAAGLEPLYVYAEVYNLLFSPENYYGQFRVTYTIEDHNGVRIEKKQSRVRKSGNASFLTLKILTDDFPRGAYKLHVTVEDLDTLKATSQSTSFSITSGIRENI